METKTAYDLNTSGAGGFITFETADMLTAVQLLALDKATLRGASGTLMELEFTSRRVHVSGAGLTEVFGHLLAGRVKVIRVGQHEGCRVDGITFFEE